MLQGVNNQSVDPKQAQTALKTGLERLISVEPDVTKYDTIVGDGDCGIGLKRGAECRLPWSRVVLPRLTFCSDSQDAGDGKEHR